MAEDFYYPNTCWGTNSARYDTFKKFLTYLTDNFIFKQW